MGIDFKVNFKTKITINGKEYGSIEEVPEEHRGTVRNAMSSAGTARSKIVVNGVGYDSLEAMPPDVRSLYTEALSKSKMTVQSTHTSTQDPHSGDLKPEGFLSSRTIIVFALLAGLAILLKFLIP